MNAFASLMTAAILPEFSTTISCLTPWLVVTGALLLLLYRNHRGR